MKIINSDREQIKPLELDIYVPEKKIAFEYDGLYSHSDLFKPNNYHLNKTRLCEEKGIRLIHIFEDEWIKKQDLIKDKVKYILGKSNDKPHIYARKCYIKEISTKSKNVFLDKYHIQGKDNSCIKLGLYGKSPKTNKNILLSVMTFCKPRIALGQKDNKYDYELSRFASNNKYVIVGSFSKLFKYFERNYEWKILITYADKRWSQGDVYLKNGWIHDHDSNPSYSYSKGTIREYRFKYRKQKLKELFPDIYSDDKTEKEIMQEAGYFRIYDCGNMVFRYERKE